MNAVLRPTSTSMKLTPLILAFTILFAALADHADAYPYKEPLSKKGAFSANGIVTVDNVNGAVTVIGWDKNEISIEGEKSAKTEEELKQIDLKMEVSDSRADIQVRLPERSNSWFGHEQIRADVAFTIHVPATATIKHVKVVNSAVTIENMRAGVNAESVNGRVSGTQLAGNVRLHTVNGGIQASFAAVSAKQELEFDTVNGGITVNLPANAGFQVHARTVNGGFSSDFPVDEGRHFLGHHIDSSVGDGRASVSLKTVNGGISLKRI